MELQVMCIYDTKARAFIAPWFVSHVDVGIRAVGQAVNDPSHAFYKNPDDYQLYHLGSFWDHNAELLPKKPELVGVVSRWKLPDVGVDIHPSLNESELQGARALQRRMDALPIKEVK